MTNILLHKSIINPSYGLARISTSEIEKLGISGDINDPFVSTVAMAKRIEFATSACKNCSAIDKMIIAGMAQNGPGFNEINVKDILSTKEFRYSDGTINWNKYFDAQKPKSPKSLLDQLRIRILNLRAGENRNYDTQFQLQVFTNDLQALVNTQTWDLPQGMSEPDLKYMQCLANRHQGDAPCQP